MIGMHATESHTLATRINPSAGYLTATASEDWTLLMEVCDRASISESAAKEAVRAIRREFKLAHHPYILPHSNNQLHLRYGEPPAQLAAARVMSICENPYYITLID